MLVEVWREYHWPVSRPWEVTTLVSVESDCPMLDVATTLSPRLSVMSVNYTPFVLSSSPTSTSFEFHSCTFASSGYQHYPPLSTFPAPEAAADSDQRKADSRLARRAQQPLKPIIIRSADSDGEQSSGYTSDGDSSPSSPTSPGRVRKQVTFADSFGQSLTQVRIMSEPSDHPPNLNPEVLASLTQGAKADVTGRPPLKLTFPQPASDYLAFRDKIEQNFVSLENVILKDYTVAGTIKVKNVSFRKRVLARFTCDSWESHEDVAAVYVTRPGDIPGRPSCHDTFTFEFEVPPTWDVTKRVEFAVCYDTCNSQQFWDNNRGANYGIVWERFLAPATPALPPPPSSGAASPKKNDPFIFGPSSLTDFACWHHVDTSVPYY